MKTILFSLLLVGLLLLHSPGADGQGKPQARTAAGWVTSPKSPVLGGPLGTCFDVAVLREGGTYRLYFSWRPKRSIALVESTDGVTWGKPSVVLGPNQASGWEDDVNRP